MTRMFLLAFAVLAPGAVASVFALSVFSANKDTAQPDVPAHLRGRPSRLYERVKDKIVEAPPELLKLAQSYPSFGDKGKALKGRRITILADKGHCKVSERVRIVHVLEAVDKGLEVYVMGPKPVYDEYVDGKNMCPKPRSAASVYDGLVLPSPAADFHYDITTYTFAKPGKHTIQWKGGGDVVEGDLNLRSNVLTINVVDG
jgi:hypothetical protein